MTRATLTTIAVVALISASFVVLAPRTTRSAQEQVIRVTARKFEYSPNEITVKKGVPVVLEITSLDRDHGFKLREFDTTDIPNCSAIEPLGQPKSKTRRMSCTKPRTPWRERGMDGEHA